MEFANVQIIKSGMDKCVILKIKHRKIVPKVNFSILLIINVKNVIINV